MTFLDFGKWKLKKCCNNLEKEIIKYNNYGIYDCKLMVEVEYDDDCFEEFELEECPSCGIPLLYYQTVEILMKYCEKTKKICYVIGHCQYGLDINRVVNQNFIEFKYGRIKKVTKINGYSYECEVV